MLVIEIIAGEVECWRARQRRAVRQQRDGAGGAGQSNCPNWRGIEQRHAMFRKGPRVNGDRFDESPAERTVCRFTEKWLRPFGTVGLSQDGFPTAEVSRDWVTGR